MKSPLPTCIVRNAIVPKVWLLTFVVTYLSAPLSLPEEMSEIPGGDCIKSIDNASLEVLVREGTKMVIHRDQVKQWTNAGSDYEKEFEAIRSRHAESFQNSLSSVISSQATGQSSQALVAVQDDEDAAPIAQSEVAGAEQPQAAPVAFESVDKLDAVDKIKIRINSEVTSVELLKTESGKVFLLCDKAKVVPKHALLGGFGSGKYLCISLSKVIFDSLDLSIDSFCSAFLMDFFRILTAIC